MVDRMKNAKIGPEEKRPRKLNKLLIETSHLVVLDQIQSICKRKLVVLAADDQSIEILLLKPQLNLIVDLLNTFKGIVHMELYCRLEAMQELKLANLQADVGVLDRVKNIQRSLLDAKGNVLLFYVLGMWLLWDLEDGDEDLSMRC